MDASSQSYADNMTGSAITPQYGIFTRMQAEDFSKPIPHVPIPAHPLMRLVATACTTMPTRAM